MFLAGCSKEVVHDSHNPNEEPWVSDLSLPVPIEIGSSGFQFETKAEMIEDETSLQNAPLWLFAIDKNSDVVPTATADNSVLIANEEARFNGTKIVFGDGTSTKTWYYPYASSYNYSFYAYHVGEATPTVMKSGTYGSLYTKIDLNTMQSDILWAKAEVEEPYTDGDNSLDGYNAKYMRAIAKDSNKEAYMPELKFKHLTTALTFKFQTIASEGNTAADEQLNKVKIESLELSNVQSQLVLWIADPAGATTEMEGKLTVANGQDSSFPVRMDCTNIEMEAVGKETTLGTLFVKADEHQEIKVKMKVSIPKTSNAEDFYTVDVDMGLKNNEDDGFFKVGSQYSYLIQMKSLEEITITASVDQWGDGDEGTDSYVEGTKPSEDGSLVIE